jgi:8-oxo-dGTP pyrophosphatase MutT (NUDIX family)
MLEFHTINQTNLSNLFKKQISKPYIVNKAFQSLSFRNLKDTHLFMTKSSHQSLRESQTYGAIICFNQPNSKGVNKTKYALVQGRYTGKWSFPKGHSNKGEQPLECTLREVAEETGIDLLPQPIEYKSLGYGKYYVFIVKDQKPLIPRDTKEIMDTKWVTLEEMENMSLNADVSMFRKKLMESVP